MLIISIMSILGLILLLIAAQLILGEKISLQNSQSSPVESGFEKAWHFNFFSSPFLFLAILFVLFDIELILLLPLIFFNCNSISVLVFLVLLLIILSTLVLEWIWSGLNWQA